MPRNIVICCDGTGKELGRDQTNVAKLHQLLDQDPSKQRSWYDPGVGTAKPSADSSRPKLSSLDRLRGLAFGWGLRENLRQAYRFLADTHEDGDWIYLFGFSRGAFTVRALAGLIYRCGLPARPVEDSAIGAAVDLYWNGATDDAISKFEKTVSVKRPMIHFLGIWDTVKSVGYLKPVCLRYTRHNRAVRAVRHALALAERRSFFQVTSWGVVASTLQGRAQDVKEVWFAGAHSDVGGGYPERESGLANICLVWMVSEAFDHGLRIDDGKATDMGLRARSVNPGVYYPANEHSSLRGSWWLAEVIPRMELQNPAGEHEGPKRHWVLKPTGMRNPHDSQKFPRGVRVHHSVRERIARGAPVPRNLELEHCTWEP